ncbi:MAG: response regulator [Candidatus Thiodiazotropha sp.]
MTGNAIKTALIVDDSKTARQVLSTKLKNYGISVETRESAAAAIDYLYDHAPDAIFMDYEMPGMDGFQALKVIKSNPNTAVIPVMMYTSKAGGLAVSQARALGAVGVLPKQLEPQDLEQVLNTLHLLPEQESLVTGFKQSDLEELKRGGRPDNVHLISEHERHQPAQVDRVSLPLDDFQDNLKGTESLKRFIRREQTQAEERLQEHIDRHFDEVRSELYELEALHEAQGGSRFRSFLYGVLGSAILLGLALAVYLKGYVDEPLGGTSASRVSNAELMDLLAVQGAQIEQLAQQLRVSQKPESAAAGAGLPMKLIEWAANQGSRFDYGSKPFSDERALWLAELVTQLKEAGFRGTVELRANHGNFCLQKNEAGEMRVAAPTLEIGQCLFASDFRGTNDWLNDQSVAFANYMNVETERSSGEIEIILFSNGFNEPLMPYPERYQVKTAGEWNDIAAQNQRVQVNLYTN